MGSEECVIISSCDRGGDPQSKEMENRDRNLAAAEGSRGQLSDGKDAWLPAVALVQWVEAAHRVGGTGGKSLQEMQKTLKLGTFKWERMFKCVEFDSREGSQRETFPEAGKNEGCHI